PDAPPPDADLTVVTGTVTRTWIDESGAIKLVESEDISKDTYAAFIPDSAAPGSYRTVAATVTGAGTFRVPGVHGTNGTRISFLLKVVRPDVAPGIVQFGVTNQAAITIDRILASRPGGVKPTKPSLLNLDIGAMDSWQMDDVLEVFCANIAAF